MVTGINPYKVVSEHRLETSDHEERIEEMPKTRIEIDRFEGTGDFSLWKVRMLAHFGVLGLKEVLSDDKLLKDMSNPKDEEDSDSQKGKTGSEESSSKIDPVKFEKSEKAKDLIVLNVGNKVLRKIQHCETAADMWSMLNKLYTETSLPNRIYLQLRFYTFKMSESKSIDENVDDFLKLVADLNNLQVEVTEEVQAILLLSSLSQKYDQLKETLKYGRDTLSLSEVTGAAKSKERELIESGKLSKSEGEGLFVERGRQDTRQNKGNGKPWKGRSKSRFGRSKSRPRTNKQSKGCFVCGKDDHWKRDCPERKSGKTENAANFVTKQPLVLTVSAENSEGEWVMDSGCSFHITPDREFLFDFKKVSGGKVLMANNTHCDIEGIGKVKIVNPDGSMVVLTEVRYMPGMSRNLISYGMLEKSGCRYEGKNHIVQFYKGNEKVISGKYHQGLYYLQGTVMKGEANISKEEIDMTKLWHSRLGHMSLKSMNVLAREGYLPEKEVKTLKFCEECVLGKSHKQSFKPAKHVTKGILDYVHSDLWGSPSSPDSLAECKYFVTFIDDYSKKVWIDFLKAKSEVFSKFREWKVAVETQTERKVKCLRTDNGLEFCNQEFDNYCK